MNTIGIGNLFSSVSTVSLVDMHMRSQAADPAGDVSVDDVDCFDSVDGKPLVVSLQDVTFNYRSDEKLIDNLNMNVVQGHIYALLGPSGCGKSTTIKIMLGLMRQQKGSVKVFGQTPNTPACPVPGLGGGFMPQDLSLMPTMTVDNIVSYYGQLSGLSPREIGKRSAYLLDLLQIPSRNRPVEKLSGGQQRRVSLAIALLHSPPLLILDEPTVGIDPLLRNKIWLYLRDLATNQSKTIIITTHYIEEARQADSIGLMRHGRLLAEANPDRLLQQFRLTTIEDVFLKLCMKEDSTPKIVRPEMKESQTIDDGMQLRIDNANENRIQFAKFQPTKAGNYHFRWRRVKAIMSDTYRLMQSKWLITLFTCILPTIQITLFHLSIGRPPNLVPITIATSENRTSQLSHLFIDSLATDINVTRSRSMEEAVQVVEAGKAFAAFEFRQNFSRCALSRARKGFAVSDYDVDCSRVRMQVDNTYQFVIFHLMMRLREAFLQSIYRFLPSYHINPEVLNSPVQIAEYLHGDEKFSYQKFMTPGMYMALIYLAPLFITLFVMLEQKTSGHIERSRANGAKPAEILIAHFLYNASLMVLQAALMMGISLNYFEAENTGSLPLLLAMVLMQGLSATAMAVLLGSALQEKVTAMVCSYGLTGLLWVLCGTFWPIQNITLDWFRELVHFLPLTLPTEAARNIMNRGLGLQNIHVIYGFASTIIYTVIVSILSFLFFN